MAKNQEQRHGNCQQNQMNHQLRDVNKCRNYRHRELHLRNQMLILPYAARSSRNKRPHVEPWKEARKLPQEVRISCYRLSASKSYCKSEPEHKQCHGRLNDCPCPSKSSTSVGLDKIRLGQHKNLLAEGSVLINNLSNCTHYRLFYYPLLCVI